jgi:hypothetical protein
MVGQWTLVRYGVEWSGVVKVWSMCGAWKWMEVGGRDMRGLRFVGRNVVVSVGE